MDILHNSNFPDQLKNLDYFLIGLGESIVSCFSKNPMQFHDVFKWPQTTWLFNHPILISFPSGFSGIYPANPISEKDQKIISLIEDFFSELSQCDCGSCKKIDDYQAEINKSFNEFVKDLLKILDIVQLEQEVSDHTSLVFFQDYSSIISDLSKEKYTLEQAQKSLLYWKDAISDTYLQKALMALQYRYIEYLANRHFF
jgi:hypothetical protein